MSNGAPLGYHPQPAKNLAVVNKNKRIEERVLQRMDLMASDPDVDKRWLAIARTHIEEGFMALNRAIFKPGRVNLDD